MKKFYLFEKEKNGKRRAYVVGVQSGDNLLKVIRDEGESLVSVYPFSSAAKADEVADILINKRASESPLFLFLKFKAENANMSRVCRVVDIFIKLKRFAVLVASMPFKSLLNIYKFFCPPL